MSTRKQDDVVAGRMKFPMEASQEPEDVQQIGFTLPAILSYLAPVLRDEGRLDVDEAYNILKGFLDYIHKEGGTKITQEDVEAALKYASDNLLDRHNWMVAQRQFRNPEEEEREPVYGLIYGNKTGNSYSLQVRIPKNVREDLNISEKTPLLVRVDKSAMRVILQVITDEATLKKYAPLMKAKRG